MRYPRLFSFGQVYYDAFVCVRRHSDHAFELPKSCKVVVCQVEFERMAVLLSCLVEHALKAKRGRVSSVIVLG